MNNSIIPDPDSPRMSGLTQIDRPAWSDPVLDREDLDDSTHHDDHGVWIKSQPVDTWTVVEEQEGRTFTADDPVNVYLDGFRHYSDAGLDWPDKVRVEGDTDPAGEGSLMTPATARRLAAALAQAADLLEGKAEPEKPLRYEDCRRFPCDTAYRRGSHPAGWHNVNWMRASEFGIEVSANAIENRAGEAQPWTTRIRIGDRAVTMAPAEVTRLITSLLNAQEVGSKANLEELS